MAKFKTLGLIGLLGLLGLLLSMGTAAFGQAVDSTDGAKASLLDTNYLTLVTEYPDSAYGFATQKAFDKDYADARVMLRPLIKGYPDITYYQIFYARSFLWEGERDSCRQYTNDLLRKNDSLIPAYEVRALNERYAGQYRTSLRYSEEGLAKDSNALGLHLNKAQCQKALMEYHEALETVQKAKRLDPDGENNELKQLETFLLNQLFMEGLTVGLYLDYFSDGQPEPWVNGFVQYGHMTSSGPILARLNLAYQRLEEIGWQLEIDAYPRINQRQYFYFNLGFSGSDIFPNLRLGAEFFSMLGNSDFEVSGGIRYLDFGATQVNMYTGSLGYYFGKNYAAYRIFIIPNEIGLGSSHNLVYRRIFGGMGDFLQLSAGFGFIPNQRILNLTTGDALQTFNTQNQYLGIAYQRIMNSEWYGRAELILSNQESFQVPDNFFRIVTIGGALGYRF